MRYRDDHPDRDRNRAYLEDCLYKYPKFIVRPAKEDKQDYGAMWEMLNEYHLEQKVYHVANLLIQLVDDAYQQ